MTSTTRTIKRPPSVPVAEQEWTDPMVNPEKANTDISRLLSEASSPDMPEITFPGSDTVSLPGGLFRDGKLIRDVQVRELTGEDEESLARASQSVNPFTFL